MAISQYPSKQEELDYLAEFIATLPRTSYLADIMPDVLRCVQDAIRNDIGYIPIGRMISDVVEARKELDQLRKDVAETKRKAQIETDVLESRARRAKQELQEVQAIASRLCRV